MANHRRAGDASRLRVAQVVETLCVGGAENLAVRIANGLAARGTDSHLVVVSEDGPLGDRIASDVTVHRLRFARASVRRPAAFLASLVAGRRILGELERRCGLDVLQTHLPGANFLALLHTFGGRAAVVPTVHNNHEFLYGDHDHRALLWARKRAYRLLLARCAAMVAVSEQVRASLESELGLPPAAAKKIRVVTNGVAVPVPLAAAERASVRAAHGVGQDEPLVLGAGRLSKQKNFPDLVRALALLRDRGRRVRAVIAGEGPDRDALAALIRELDLESAVALPGNVGDLDRLMGAADVFALTSLWEGLPLVLLEAMASGLPVVGYDIAGVADVVEDGVSGLLAATGDAATLADRLARVLDDAALRTRLGSGARALVERRFDFSRLLDRLEDVYAAAV